MPTDLRLSLTDARRLHRRAVLLDAPAAGIAAALCHHGFIQIDPINVCGRMQDLILRNRVSGYREGDLMRHLHGPAGDPHAPELRTAFEHHLPGSNNLAAMPLEAWPYLLATMRARTKHDSTWSGKLDAREKGLAKTILAEITQRGALSSEDIDDDRRSHHGWGTRATLAKTTLHKLFFHGRVLISHRQGQRRLYDLPGRVLPAATLALAEASTAETARWITLLKLRQRRVAMLSRAEWQTVADEVQPVIVDGCPALYCLREDVALLDEPAATESPALLLAPLDPLIYDRRVTRALWGFDYTWEVYTPPAKRVRGYYALPLLSGLEIAGHIDPKADRPNKQLRIINRSIRRGFKAAAAVRELAQFLGLR